MERKESVLGLDPFLGTETSHASSSSEVQPCLLKEALAQQNWPRNLPSRDQSYELRSL